MTQTDPPAAPARAPHHQQRRRARRGGPRWLDFSIAATALVVSTASLLVARHQAQVMDRQLAASVWPSVRYSYSNDHPGPNEGPLITFDLNNHGVGPAKLKAFRVFYRGRPVRDRYELAAACCDVDPAHGPPPGIALVQSYVTGRVQAANEQIHWLSVRGDPTRLTSAQVQAAKRVFVAFQDAIGEVAVRVCYCSVLDECWVATERSDEAARIESCATEQKKPQYN